MKKSLFFIFVGFCIVSCNGLVEKGPDEIVKEKTMQIFSFIKNNQLDSVRVIYPDFSEEYMRILTDSIKITDVKQDLNSNVITVNFTNYYSESHEEKSSVKRNITFTYCLNDSNKYYVIESVGLVNKEDLPVEAKLTGYLKYKAQDNDHDIIKDLNVLDTIKTEKEKKKFEEAKNQVTLEIWFKTGRNARPFYRIFNRSDQVVGYVQFKTKWKYAELASYTETPSARDIYPYTTMDTRLDFSEFASDWDKRPLLINVRLFHLVSYEITNITFPYLTVGELDYEGNEYAEYIKKKNMK